MYNQQINQYPFNTGITFAPGTVTDDIIFNGFGLQNINIVTNFKNDQDFPIIDLQTWQNPIVDGGGVLNRRFVSKDITLRGTLKSNTENELNTLIDTFKLNTSAVEGYLDIKVNGVYRRTKATCVKSDVFKRETYDITRCQFEITFQTIEPFFYLKTTQAYLETGITGNINIDRTYTGTAKTNPQFYIVFGPSVASTTAISIEANDALISIAKTIGNNDILIIDCEAKTVTLNAVAIDYTGTFPFLINGSNVLDIKINGTFTCDISILYLEKYL